MEQFTNFELLVSAIEPLSLRAGVCKIIPPCEWRTQLESQEGDGKQQRVFCDEEFPILKPIVQHFNGSAGVFHQYNVEFHRKVKLAQFFQTSQDESHRGPDIKSDREEEQQQQQQQQHIKDDGDDVCYGSDTVGIAVDYTSGRVQLTSAAAETIKSGLRSDSARMRFRPATAEYRPQPDSEGEPASEPNGEQPQRRFTLDDHRPLFVSASEYAENEELERTYWKNLLFQPPMYGADVLGTLFPEPNEFPTWNIRELPGLLQKVGRKMPGVNDPYLYLGMWKATFAWHVEDMDLYSINYIHFGAPKAWYSIPVEANGRFERAMQNVFATDYKHCSQFLRHKAFLLSPRFLASQGIPFNRVVQRAGEIMLTFPLGYHAGFNHGFNCAESVNFALDRWLSVARNSKHCECVKDSVTIDLMEWFGGVRANEEEEGESADAGNSSKRVSPRRHAAAAAALARNSSRDARASSSAKLDAPAVAVAAVGKRLPGRPRKAESVATTASSSPATTTTTTTATRKRKSTNASPDDNIEPRAKRPATIQTTEQQQPSEEEPIDVYRCVASLHTPVGTCGACLLAIDPSATFVECQQCGLTVHPQCSALSYDDGNYKCANCVMDTDQLSCALCAYQNGLLLPVVGTNESKYVHFLCAHFIDELYFDLATDSNKARDENNNSDAGGGLQQQQQQQKMVTRSRSSHSRKPVDNGLARVCGVDKVAKSRFAAKCMVCLGRCFGAVVQCAHHKCFKSFHPMCAATADPLLLDWTQAKIYCPAHATASSVTKR
ncbi:hypothetical protein LPJ57_002859 [Coemansia sp. RSA 486]|nr:hypothetical protein LPJ57_002859 [Coemansia sp. RSA 486]